MQGFGSGVFGGYTVQLELGVNMCVLFSGFCKWFPVIHVFFSIKVTLGSVSLPSVAKIRLHVLRMRPLWQQPGPDSEALCTGPACLS